MKLDLEYKDEKISALQKEMEELTTGGATDEEVSALKRQKHDLDLRLKDQVWLEINIRIILIKAPFHSSIRVVKYIKVNLKSKVSAINLL